MTEKDTATAGRYFEKLLQIMMQLRSPEGCPWDRQQSHESLRPYLIEETYEVLESLDRKNQSALREELGDLLLQIVFHAQIASENNDFTIENVIESISEKLIRRHPNVFGDVRIESAEEQSINWEKLKKQEGKRSVLDGVPKALPALLRAWRIQQKASTVGFDWQTDEPVWEKVHEEIDELMTSTRNGERKKAEEEFGDLMFALVNLSRFLEVNPEDALRKATDKFITRFLKIEEHYAAKKKEMSDATLEELDEAWERVKAEE